MCIISVNIIFENLVKSVVLNCVRDHNPNIHFCVLRFGNSTVTKYQRKFQLQIVSRFYFTLLINTGRYLLQESPTLKLDHSNFVMLQWYKYSIS